MSAEEGPRNKCKSNGYCGNDKPDISATGNTFASWIKSHVVQYCCDCDESDAYKMTSVEKVRRLSGILFVAVATFLISSPTVVSGSTTTTTTTVPVLCPPAPLDPTVTTVPLVGCVNPVATTTTTTTTTTLPVAATTVPEGCALPPVAQAVFKGTVTSLDTVSAVFAVQQLRAGSLDGYASNNEVSVRYGSDAKYLEVGQAYLVGVAQDSVTLRLTSTLRDQPELFGGAEVVGTQRTCPEFEAAARTLNVDGTSIPTGMLDKLFGQPWRLVAALVLPPALVLCALFAAVWFRRGLRR
jgi:hypothetical protein